MIRRYVYDSSVGAVVELGLTKHSRSPLDAYDSAHQEYETGRDVNPSLEAGSRFLDAALERADRREFAHRKYGNEARWAE